MSMFTKEEPRHPFYLVIFLSFFLFDLVVWERGGFPCLQKGSERRFERWIPVVVRLHSARHKAQQRVGLENRPEREGADDLLL